jgi:hypothetical protein
MEEVENDLQLWIVYKLHIYRVGVHRRPEAHG